MNEATRRRARRLQDRFVDEVRFLKQWVENPLQTGSVAPSGRMLSRMMASHVEADRAGPIVELGPGTGVITEAMRARGIDEHRLILIEYCPEFCTLLRQRFPRATVVQGNAYALGEVLKDLADGSLASVISGLPLFTQPLAMREKLLTDSVRLMEPGAPFIQLSYALVPAVPTKTMRYDITRTQWIVANLPPARVWLYRCPATNLAAAGPAARGVTTMVAA